MRPLVYPAIVFAFVMQGCWANSGTGQSAGSDGGSNPATDGGSDTDTGETVACWVPDTGQRKCIDSRNEWVECETIEPDHELYGQDGHFRPPSRERWFESSLDGTASEEVTGLMWEREHSESEMEWYKAEEYCDERETAGHTDWRVPTVLELSTIVDASRFSPSMEEFIFPEFFGELVWTFTALSNNASNFWTVDFSFGTVFWFSTSDSAHVLCVRGEPLVIQQFDYYSIAGERVVEDEPTGLIWQGCAAGQTGEDCEIGSPEEMDWPAALKYCRDLAWTGQDDWRLPDRNELQSIVRYEVSGPCIATAAFPNSPTYYFHTSTTMKSIFSDYETVWRVEFYYGVVDEGWKDQEYHVRCVRAGP